MTKFNELLTHKVEVLMVDVITEKIGVMNMKTIGVVIMVMELMVLVELQNLQHLLQLHLLQPQLLRRKQLQMNLMELLM